MRDILEVRWTAIALDSPQPWLPCSMCGRVSAFRSSDRVRLNANGRKVDAWLIYKCTPCDKTWNRPLLERAAVGSVPPEILAAMQASEPGWVRARAFDLDALRRHTPRIDEPTALDLAKRVIHEPPDWQSVEIHLVVPHPAAVRLDRLLAAELPLARSRLAALARDGGLVLAQDGTAGLRRRLRDGSRLLLHLSPEADRAVWRRAAGGDR